MRFDNKERESSVSLYITYLNQVLDLCTLTFTHVPAVRKVKNNSTCVLCITKPKLLHKTISLCFCMCGGTMPECPGGSGPEEPCNAAAKDSRLGGPGCGAAGRASLCRVWPQERRLSCGILSIATISSQLPSAGQSPQRHSDRITMRRCLHWRLKHYLSYGDTATAPSLRLI